MSKILKTTVVAAAMPIVVTHMAETRSPHLANAFRDRLAAWRRKDNQPLSLKATLLCFRKAVSVGMKYLRWGIINHAAKNNLKNADKKQAYERVQKNGWENSSIYDLTAARAHAGSLKILDRSEKHLREIRQSVNMKPSSRLSPEELKFITQRSR